MQRERKVRAVVRALGEPSLRKGDELVFACPRKECSPGKVKLSVNVVTERFHCWICDWSGKNLLPILRIGGRRDDVEEYSEHLERRFGPGRCLILAAPDLKRYDVPELPPEFRTLSRDWGTPYYRDAVTYLSGRGVRGEDVLRWKLGYCEDGPYRYRIIVPSFDVDGHLNFFVGRTFYQGSGKNYKHGNFNKDIIWNELMIDWSRPLTVVEGPFDAMKVRGNVTALQGSSLREDSKLFKKIVESGQDTYFAMDADAVRKQLRIVGSLLRFGVRCFCVPLGGRADVAEMTHGEFERARERATLVETGIDLVRERAST